VLKTPRLKAGQVKCDDDVWGGSPPNLEISLIAEMAGICKRERQRPVEKVRNTVFYR
jgi:hypothetical protein